MTPESLFLVGNNTALVCWILLILLPRFQALSRFVLPVVAGGLLAVLYICLIITNVGQAEGGFTSLDGVEQLFQNRYLLLAGWVHYLVFDLFVGCWEARDAQRLGIPHMLLVPALLLTFMFGPAGLLTYYVIRFVRARKLDIEERGEVIA
jgi:hypothetical protein